LGTAGIDWTHLSISLFVHRLWIETTQGLQAGQELTVSGDEAEHAVRVKRVEVGEEVELLDGVGGVCGAVVLESVAGGKRGREVAVRLEVRTVRRDAMLTPRVEVCSATPKGGRVDDMLEQLSQLGVWSWRAMRTARGVVDPRQSKLERLERIVRESAKQCGRTWVMRVGEPVEFASALAGTGDGGGRVNLLVADARGEDVSCADDGFGSGDVVRMLVGPEGGFTAEELGQAIAAGARLVRLGPWVMRIETAACAASAIVLRSSR
jgi:16S rRNA (uracil1498-N3)-methyltransferase